MTTAQQAGQGLEGQKVALRAEAGDHADCSRAYVRMMPEALTLVDVGKMNLDSRSLGCIQRIEQGHGRMGVGAGIDDDAGIPLAGSLYEVDQNALMIALREFDRKTQAQCFGPARFLDVRQGLVAVDLRLPLAQHVEIWPVEYQHRLECRPTPGSLCGQACLPNLHWRAL